MIGVGAIAVEIPEHAIDTLSRARALGADLDTLRKKIGFERLSCKAQSQTTSDLAVGAIEKLLSLAALEPDDIECLILVTQNPDGRGLPHTSAVVHGKLGLASHCAAFDISLGCSGYVYGLAVISSLMNASGMTRGLLVTADPYSKIVDPSDRNTALLFGDGATATLMTDTPIWELGRFDLGTDGERCEALQVNDEHLQMNGRAVFNFSVLNVPTSVKMTLELNELTLDDVDRFVLHQGSRFIVESIGRKLGVEARTPFCAAGYGNLVSSSIPVVLAQNISEADRTVLISGFGVGLSWASTVLKRV